MIKKFTVAKERTWKIIDCIVILLLITIQLTNFKEDGVPVILMSLRRFSDVFSSIIKANSTAEFFLYTIVVLFVFIVFSINILAYPFFIPILYIGFRIAISKSLTEKLTFTGEMNIQYFRDTFSNVSPTTASLLMDLDIEAGKDIAATLLSMYNRKIIFIHSDHIEYNPQNTSKLLNSEKILLEYIKNSSNKTLIKKWKTQCIIEAEDAKFLEINTKVDFPHSGNHFSFYKRKKKLSLVARLCITSCIIIMLIGVLQIFTKLSDQYYLNNYININIDSDTNLDTYYMFFAGCYDYNNFINNPDFIRNFLYSLFNFFIIILSGIFIFSGLYLIAHNRKYKQMKSPLIRTKKGERTAEKLLALKNYIHDFTLLNEAQKEKVLLWDDYLVFALILEENESIVSEISKYFPGLSLFWMREL
ncbi:DUF2207 family protein [Anaerosphaera multitolerans]|uniref:DUF2207 domain-containing protein n=1 Tax=Anaerosphaera multitolerans TaxID=2487351 RepID=A0A437S5P7_9FIRM|nr:DUF2207 domain-containing protein [Anaerosphaera multitolerans]RVU54308.1 DUF2207 domain-containing protein [Anaerosphaera multitolerans]